MEKKVDLINKNIEFYTYTYRYIYFIRPDQIVSVQSAYFKLKFKKKRIRASKMC